MGIPQFKDVTSLSNNEISEAIIRAEKELFTLRFKKATRQPFKPHEIKHTKRRLAHLKTLLTLRLDMIEKKQSNVLVELVKKNNYMTENY
jgi:large subunit ribosomal protein L29|uniref:ribosomal protein L29 n=1 Tax=Guinardia delicatula TaxID=1244696 RepID=UPI0022F2C0F4|nr:ribosomal protein L29 [Guinardia delicatula]WAJ58116.1 ribosomal protein L29 [Guinardia delicatula]